MATSPLGRALVIANPASHSGKGARDAAFAEHFFGAYRAATAGYEVRLTTAPGDAEQIARAAAAEGFDSVIALGGDGVIHEAVNGLMSTGSSADTRPQLGIVPVGSGNDYARTLDMPRNDAAAALARLVRGTVSTVEVGHVRSSAPEGATADDAYFMQTLSFGLDAAIALDTTSRRAAQTKQEGEALFITSGIKILGTARRGFPCTASFDDEPATHVDDLVFAVQVGQTYGGGFRICPDADPADGLLDVCYNVARPSIPRILALFALARSGRHTGSRALELRRVHRVQLAFHQEPPAQADGEKLHGTSFDAHVVPAALRVIH